jgi:hypothetical protein
MVVTKALIIIMLNDLEYIVAKQIPAHHPPVPAIDFAAGEAVR